MAKKKKQKIDAKAPALTEEQTAGTAQSAQLHREFAEHPTKGLTPARLYQILEGAEQGDLKAQSELFEDMEEKDPQIGSDLAKRRQLAAELEWQIVPPDNPSRAEKMAAEHAAEVFDGLEVEDLIIDMGAALGHGWANLELCWDRDGAMRYIEQPVFRPHGWFRLHPENQNSITLRDNSQNGAELWPLGWVQHRHKAKPGYIARSGLCRMLAWPYLFQNYALGDLAQLLEIYGIPARVGQYPRNASDKEKLTLLRAVTSLGSNAAGIIPEGMKIEFMEAANGKADMFTTMMTWCERSKSKVILGGTLTSGTGEGTNTNALGNVHERALDSLIRSDIRQYGGTINRDILWPMASLNFGIDDRRRAPQFKLDMGETEDFAVLSESLPKFVEMGARIPMWWFHEKSGIPEAGDKDEVLTIAPKAPPAKPSEEPPPDAALRIALAALKGPVNSPQGALNDVINAIGPATQQDQAETLLKPIMARIQAGDNYDAIQDDLSDLYPDLDVSGVEDMLTKLFFVAETWGRLNV